MGITKFVDGTGPLECREPFVLGSGSPRRRDLLASAGLGFEIVPSPADEPDPVPGELPEVYAERAAHAKALAVAALRPEAVVLGADTIVVAPEGRILGKPRDEAEARDMVSMLCGDKRRTHKVITGCCVILPQGICGSKDPVRTFHAHTSVTMGAQTQETIAAYVATGEPMDKAGAYAIQGSGAFLVEHVEGSYTNVVGLPLARVLEVLREWNVVMPKRT